MSESVGGWFRDMISGQSEGLKQAIRFWQEGLKRVRWFQLGRSVNLDPDEDELVILETVDVIDKSFLLLPAGTVLWHATLDPNWKYSADM